MRKGVSPVVATVLLIAIAVIAAVAVWYWVSPMTGSQPTPATSQYGYAVTSKYMNTSSNGCWSIDLKNSGGLSIPANTIFEIRLESNGSLSGKYLNISVALAPGQTKLFNLTNSTGYTHVAATNANAVGLGTYLLRASTASAGSISGFSDVYFTC